MIRMVRLGSDRDTVNKLIHSFLVHNRALLNRVNTKPLKTV